MAVDYDAAADAILAARRFTPSGDRITTGKISAGTILVDPPPLPTTLAGAFEVGVEAGMDALSTCCGCSGSGIEVPNPYNAQEGS